MHLHPDPIRLEHLRWSKARALAYLDPKGPHFSVYEAGTSFINDMGNHEKTRSHSAVLHCYTLLYASADEMRAFIESVG